MLQGLVIRRSFVMVDLALVVLVLGVAGLIVAGVFEEASNPFAEAMVSDPVGEGAVEGILIDVGPRGDYDRILSSHIFGPAGDEVSEPAEPPPPPEPVEEEVEETPLNLELLGTVATSPLDPLASATIENKESRDAGIHVYGLGDEIVEEVFLREVYPREVILANHEKREVLRMDEEEESDGAPLKRTLASPSRAPSQPAHEIAPPERFSLKKQDFIRQLYVNYGELVTKVQPQMYYDENGDVAGITASNIEEIPLAKTLDLKDGDVLQTINNENIDSEQAIIKLINKYRDSSVFRIGILRGGKPLMRTYRLE